MPEGKAGISGNGNGDGTSGCMASRYGYWLRNLGAPVVGALSAFLAAMAVTAVVVHLEAVSQGQSQRLEALSRLSAVRASLEGTLNAAMLAAHGLVALVTIRPEISADDFARMAKELMDHQPRIRNIGLGFGTVLRYVYPVTGNEAVIGMDYMARPDQRDAVLRMIETGRTVVAGPIALVQGGHGIVSRTPIFLPTADGKGRTYWGLVSIPIDMDGLFADAGLLRQDLPIDIAIRGKDGLGERGAVFFGDAPLFEADPVLLEVRLPAGTWQIAAVAKGGWRSDLDAALFVGALGAVLSLLLATATFLAISALGRLEVSERQFRSALDDAPIPIMLHDGDQVVAVNRAWVQLTGYAASELLTVSDWKVLAYPRKGAADPDDLWRGERAIRTAGGVMRVWEFSSRYVSSARYRNLIVSMAVDITDRKLTEIDLRRHKDAAEQANIAKSAFLANMSHELRTPLTAVIGFSEMIQAETHGPNAGERYRDYAGDIIASGRHLLGIINDLLDVSKIEAGKMEIMPERVDTRALLAAAVRISRDAAIRRSVDISTAIDDDATELWADAQAARQILINLLSNAIKFSADGGHVAVAASQTPDGGVEIAVADDGIGIPPERLPTLMKPFEQVDNRYARPWGGTGLGLALVKGLAERHGGSVAIRSTPGLGTTVTVRFPPRYAAHVSPQA